MSISHRPDPEDKIFSRRAEKDVYKIKAVSREYQVPLLAGYSRDRKTLYIDCDSASGFFCKLLGEHVETDKYWCIHEYVEDSCENNGADYLLAHSLATLAELKAVEDDGVDEKEYNRFCDEQVKKAGGRPKYDNLPPDLDTKPYYQDHESVGLLKRMGYIHG